MVVITRGDNSLVLSAHHQGPEQRTAEGGEKSESGPTLQGPVWLQGGSSLVHSIVNHLDGRSVSGLSCTKSLYGSSLAQ